MLDVVRGISLRVIVLVALVVWGGLAAVYLLTFDSEPLLPGPVDPVTPYGASTAVFPAGVASEPEASPPTVSVETEVVQAAESGQPAPPPSGAAITAFAIQVGAFKSPSGAGELTGQLESRGYKVLQRSGSDGLHRVYVGPFQSKAEADETQFDLLAQGLQGFVKPLP